MIVSPSLSFRLVHSLAAARSAESLDGTEGIERGILSIVPAATQIGTEAAANALLGGAGTFLRGISSGGANAAEYRYQAGDDYDSQKAALRMALSAGGVAAGSALSGAVNASGLKLLRQLGKQNYVLPNVALGGASALGYAAGETGLTELSKAMTDEDYTPDWNAIGKTGLTAFAFGAITRAIDIWQSDYLLSQKYGTVKTYKAQIATHIKPALGAVKLSKLTPHLVQGFYNDLLANGRTVPKRDKHGKIIKKKGVMVTETAPLNAKTVRNVHGVLTKALSQAVKLGYIARNPCDMVDLPRVEKAHIMPLTDEQVKAYLSAADSDNDYGDILKVILFTGLREAEATGLTWDCVDFKKGTVTVCKQLQKRPAEAGGFQFAALKNDKTRILRPAPFVMDMLRAVRSKQAQRRLQAGDLWQDWIDPAKQYAACRLVFTNVLGDHLHPQRLYAHHKKIAAKAGAPDARVHDLRHTFAVLSLQNGDDVKTVQENLGHATAAFTLDVYGHVSERMKEDSAARMQGYFENLKKA